MFDNNAFGQEIDDDGLPKYSPDRNNVAAYHMFKMGLSETMPDPEEFHTPFFRTPSYYREKELRERQASGEPFGTEVPKPDKAEPFVWKPFRLEGNADAPNPPPASKPAPLAPDGNGQDGLGHGASFGQRLLEHVFPGQAFPEPAPEPTPDQRLQNQAEPTPVHEPRPVPAQPKAPPLLQTPAFPEQDMPERPGENTAKPENAIPDLSGDDDGTIHHRARLLQNLTNDAMELPDLQQHADVAPIYIARPLGLAKPEDAMDIQALLCKDNANKPDPTGQPETAEGLSFGAKLLNAIFNQQTPADIQTVAQNGAPEMQNQQQPETIEELNQLPAPSAGKRERRPVNDREPAFTDTNPDNPQFVPLAVNTDIIKQFRVPKNRREVSLDMTNEINTDLTYQNRGYPVGINFTVLSRLEGGSNPKANVPMSDVEIQRARERQRQIREAITSNPKRALELQKQENREPNKSGVTIGSGYDLGQTSVNEMKQFGLPDSLIEKCRPYIGKKRLDALDAINARPLILTNDEIDAVNRAVMTNKARKCIYSWDNWITDLRKTNPNAPYFHEMSSNQQTIVFSRYYHEGQGWADNEHNQPIYDAMTRNDWDTVARLWRALVLDKTPPKKMQERIRGHKYWPEWKAGRFAKDFILLKKTR